MKNPLTRRIQIQWMVATAFAVVSIAGCTGISGTLTWNKGDIVVPRPIIGTVGHANPITLQDEINLQTYLITRSGWSPVGRVTYGKVSISGREVSVPYFVDDLPAPTPTSGPVMIVIITHPKPGGLFVRGPYNPNNDRLDVGPVPLGPLAPDLVTLTSTVPITGHDFNYYKSLCIGCK